MDKKGFGVLLFSNFVSNSVYAIVIPFLPIEFSKYGLEETDFGYIFAIYAFANMFFSFL